MRPTAEAAASARRLQRRRDFTGAPLTTFQAVFLRHGLPGLLLGLLCLMHPGLRALLGETLSGFRAEPLHYVFAAVVCFAVLGAFTWVIDRRLTPGQIGWVLYLLALSAWEEWVFRLALPALAMEQDVAPRAAVIASNVLFGLMHYFTLRWKWQWCVAAGLGGLALSRNLDLHQDLALVIGIHWVATFLNTPRPPGARLDKNKRGQSNNA